MTWRLEATAHSALLDAREVTLLPGGGPPGTAG
jgi:hypothetical protein